MAAAAAAAADHEDLVTAARSRAFSVLHDKTVAVAKVALCPKMDLLALLAADGSLVVLRTISWQKLHALPAAELQDENRVTALAWSPDGNVLALGHERGGISLFDVEKGEMSPQPLGGGRPEGALLDQSEVLVLAWLTQHQDPARMSALDKEKERSHAAAKYYLERDEVFLEDLPALGQQSGSFAAPKDRKEDPVGAKLTAGAASLDVLVACFKSGGVLVLSSGLFPLLSLRLHDLIPAHLSAGARSSSLSAGLFATPMAPSSRTNANATTTPSPMQPPAASPASSTASGSTPTPSKKAARAALRVQAVTATPDLGSLVFAVGHGDGTRDGTSLLALPTPALWEHRHQLKPLTVEFAALSTLVTHLQEALDLAERHWKDGLRTLDIKLDVLNNLLRDYSCQATAREAFLSLVISGTACTALDQYLSQNGSEPQQHNLFRLSKTIDDKASSVEALLREQVGRVAEMVVFRASKLRGLARTGDDFRAVGLSVRALSALVDAAGCLSLKAEEALREVQAARQNLKVFLLWLLDTMQHWPAAGAEPPAAPDTLGFRHSPKHVRMLLSFLRKPCPPPPPLDANGKPQGSNTEAVIAAYVSAYFKDEPLASGTTTTTEDAEGGGGGGVAEGLATVSLRTQVKEVRARFEAVFKRPLDALRSRLASCRMLRLSSGPLVAAPDFYAGPDARGVVVAAVDGQGTRALLLSLQVNAQTWKTKDAAFFPLQALTLAVPRDCLLQQAALYGGLPLLPSPNPESLVLLARGAPQSLADGRASADLWKLPLASLLPALRPVEGKMGPGGLLDELAASSSFSSSSFPLGRVEGVRARQLSAVAPQQLLLSVTGTRGVATVTAKANYLLLVDLEEDDEDEEEEGDEMEEVEAAEERGGEQEAEGMMEVGEEEDDEDAKSAS